MVQPVSAKGLPRADKPKIIAAVMCKLCNESRRCMTSLRGLHQFQVNECMILFKPLNENQEELSLWD